MNTCAKRRYGSKRAARAAHRSANWRVGVYWCDDCHGFHVRNQEKRR